MLNATSGFSSAFFDPVISNCKVIIYDAVNDDAFLVSSDLKDFSYSARNKYVGIEYPTERLTFTVLKYSELTNSEKGYLQEGLFIWVRYLVNNSTKRTTTKKYFYIEKVEIDNNDNVAYVSCIGLLETLTAVANDYQWGSLSSVQSFNLPTDITRQLIKTYYSACVSDLSSFVVVSQDNIPNVYINGLPQNLTKGEVAQNVALLNGGTLALSADTVECRNYTHLDSSNIASFGVINVYDKYTITKEENDYDTAYVQGYSLGMAQNFSTTVSGGTAYIDVSFNNWVAKSGSSSSIGNWKFKKGQISKDTGGGGTINANISEKYFPNINQNVVFQTYLVPSGDNTLSSAKTIINDYFSNKQMIEFRGRINPQFEVLDVLYMDNYYFYIEEIDIDYNGAFTGRIKGRIIEGVLKPAIISVDTTPASWSIVVHNPNPYFCVLHIHTSGGTFDVDIDEGSNKTINYNLLPDFDTYIQGYNIGDLTEDIYVYFDDEEGSYSDNVILLEA